MHKNTRPSHCPSLAPDVQLLTEQIQQSNHAALIKPNSSKKKFSCCELKKSDSGLACAEKSIGQTQSARIEKPPIKTEAPKTACLRRKSAGCNKFSAKETL